MKVSKNFVIQEYVPEKYYKEFGGIKLIGLIDSRLIQLVQNMREIYGGININTWHIEKGGAEMRGWRPWWSPVGVDLSQHKFGRGVDLIFADADHDEVCSDVAQDNKFWYNLGLRRMHKGDGYIHIDLAETKKSDVIVFF